MSTMFKNIKDGMAVLTQDEFLPSYLFHVFVRDEEEGEIGNYTRSFFSWELAKSYFDSLS
jgi:hypothetical protein